MGVVVSGEEPRTERTGVLDGIKAHVLVTISVPRRWARIALRCVLMLVTLERETLEARLKAPWLLGTGFDRTNQPWVGRVAHAPLFDFLVPDADIMTDASTLFPRTF
jgi:hypothetical protein